MVTEDEEGKKASVHGRLQGRHLYIHPPLCVSLSDVCDALVPNARAVYTKYLPFLKQLMHRR